MCCKRSCVHLQPLQEIKSIADNRESDREVHQRCFHRRDSLHRNADTCWCFTTSGSPGTDATQRSRTVKTKMEECYSSCLLLLLSYMNANAFVFYCLLLKEWSGQISDSKVDRSSFWKVHIRTHGGMYVWSEGYRPVGGFGSDGRDGCQLTIRLVVCSPVLDSTP